MKETDKKVRPGRDLTPEELEEWKKAFQDVEESIKLLK